MMTSGWHNDSSLPGLDNPDIELAVSLMAPRWGLTPEIALRSMRDIADEVDVDIEALCILILTSAGLRSESSRVADAT